MKQITYTGKLFFLYSILCLPFLKAQEKQINAEAYKSHTINLPCNNAGFETGDTQAWDGFWGQAGQEDNTAFCPSKNCPPYITAGFNPAQHTVTSGNGYDSFLGGNLLPVVCPGGTHSIRIGDTLTGNQTLGKANCTNSTQGNRFSRVSQTFKVSAENPNFIYKYAVVLEDPQDQPHTDDERPRLKIDVLDQAGNHTNCGQYDVIVKPGLDGFNLVNRPPSEATCPCLMGPGMTCPPAGYTLAPNGQVIQKPRDIYWKNWTTIVIPLSAYIGQNVTVQFTVKDCAKGGHVGYAYIDGDCFPRLSLTMNCKGGTITGPADGVSYSWTGPGIVGANNTQSIQVNKDGKYTLTMVSVAGACPAIFDTIITLKSPTDTASFKNTTVCEGLSTSFTDLSGPKAGITGWTWDFGGGNTSTLQNPVFTFSSAGTYPVKLTTDWGGCKDDTIINVVVHPKPKPDIAINASCTKQVVFTGSSMGGTIQNWNWNFGDNTTSTEQNPSHQYASLGNYTVTLVVTNINGCIDSVKKPVNLTLSVRASATANEVCAGTPTSFTDLSSPSGSITSWTWDFGGGNSSTNQHPSFVFTAAGTYPVKLTVSSGGCADDTTIQVIVNPAPKPDFTSNTVCTMNAVFTDNSGGGAPVQSWNWNFGDNTTSTEKNPAHTYATTGNYDIWLVVTSAGGCKDSINKTIVISPVTHSGFTSTIVCIGHPTVFTDTSKGNPTIFHWNFGEPSSGGDNASTLQHPTHTYGAAGNYTVTYTASIPGGCSDTVKQPVIVVGNLTANFNSTTGCLGTPVMFTDASTQGVTSWNWNFGEPSSGSNNTSTLKNPSHTYAIPGTYTITLIVDGGGCGDTVMKPVTVSPPPTVKYTADDTTGCFPHCVNFKDGSSVAGGKIVEWEWAFGDGNTSSIASPLNCYQLPGVYSLSLTVTADNGCKATYVHNNWIHVYPRPKAAFTADPSITTPEQTLVQFTDQSSGADFWYWYFGDGDSTKPLVSDPQHLYPNDVEGTYIATLIVENQYGCKDTAQGPIVIRTKPEWTFYVPNCITPNGDGNNDYFFSKETGVVEKEMWIYDRWGNEIFYSNRLDGKWDGKVQDGPSNDIAQIDTYVWLIKIKEVFGGTHRYIGHVSIVK